MFGFKRKKDNTAPHEQEALVHAYIAAIETEESTKWCKCLWRIHPDDVLVKSGHCRVCGNSARNSEHGESTHHFRGVRRTRIEDHLLCPVHTREGFLLGFITWAAGHEQN